MSGVAVAAAAFRGGAPRRWLVSLLCLALLVTVSLTAASAPPSLVIPLGREAVVLEMVRAAWVASGESGENKYNIKIERDRVRVQLSPGDVALLVFAEGAGPHQLAPGVVLRCAGNPRGECEATQIERWRLFAVQLALGRDRARDQVWTQPPPTSEDAPVQPTDPTLSLERVTAMSAVGALLFGLVWLGVYSGRALVQSLRQGGTYRFTLLATAALVLVFAGVALWGTAALPLHEHNSYVARNDCAWTLGCTEDPAGPAWVASFFAAYRPLLRAFSYSVANTCRFSLALAACVILLARHWFVRALANLGWSETAAQRTALGATALLCLNPISIRVAVSGTPWPYVLLCLFGSGLACFEAVGGTTRARRRLAALAGTCLFASVVNSNLVMLSLLPLVWLGPISCRPAGARSWLPTAGELLSAIALLALSFSSIVTFIAAWKNGAHAFADGLKYHVFFDERLLPPSLGVLMLVGVAVCVRRRTPLLAVIYVAAITHPTLATYGGHPLGSSYPVGFINAYFETVLCSLLAAVGAAWLLKQAAARGRHRQMALALGLALIAPMPLAGEGWSFMRGSRVLERELSQISLLLPQLPEHDLLLTPTPIQPLLDGCPPTGSDPVEVRFPDGEYMAIQASRGRKPAKPLPLLRTQERPPPPRTLIYVGVSLRAFLRVESDANLVPESLERPELSRLRERYRLEPVFTFELTPEQHALIPWRLGADRQARVTLGFYWLRPLADEPSNG